MWKRTLLASAAVAVATVAGTGFAAAGDSPSLEIVDVAVGEADSGSWMLVEFASAFPPDAHGFGVELGLQGSERFGFLSLEVIGDEATLVTRHGEEVDADDPFDPDMYLVDGALLVGFPFSVGEPLVSALATSWWQATEDDHPQTSDFPGASLAGASLEPRDPLCEPPPSEVVHLRFRTARLNFQPIRPECPGAPADVATDTPEETSTTTTRPPPPPPEDDDDIPWEVYLLLLGGTGGILYGGVKWWKGRKKGSK